MVSPECVHDEGVRDTAKGVLEIKESDVCRSLVLPSTLYNFFHHNVVLYAPVDAGQEGLLHAGVHQLVCDEIGSEALVDQKMKSFANATTESYHSEVCWICRITFLV